MKQSLEAINRARQQARFQQLLTDVMGPQYQPGDPVSHEQLQQLAQRAYRLGRDKRPRLSRSS